MGPLQMGHARLISDHELHQRNVSNPFCLFFELLQDPQDAWKAEERMSTRLYRRNVLQLAQADHANIVLFFLLFILYLLVSRGTCSPMTRCLCWRWRVGALPLPPLGHGPLLSTTENNHARCSVWKSARHWCLWLHWCLDCQVCP